MELKVRYEERIWHQETLIVEPSCGSTDWSGKGLCESSEAESQELRHLWLSRPLEGAVSEGFQEGEASLFAFAWQV